MQQEVYENLVERDSYFDNDEIEATSVAKDTKEEEKDQKLSRIKELTGNLEVSRIMKRHLKRENETYKTNNEKLIKENEKLSEEVGKLKSNNNILYIQAFRWLKEKNSWKVKYEKQKVKASFYKEE